MYFKFTLTLVLFVLGEWRAAAKIIQVPPQFVLQPSTGEILFQVAARRNDPDKPFRIECEAKGEPPPKYRWTKNGNPFNWQDSEDRITQIPEQGTLIVTSPRNEDAGQYQCFAENRRGIATSNSVFVRKFEMNFFKDEATEVITVEEGRPFNLSCEPPYAYPRPSAYWVIQHEDGKLKPIENERLQSDPTARLWFSNVTKDDASFDTVYACLVTSLFWNQIQLGNKVSLRVVPSSTKQREIATISQYLSPREQTAIVEKSTKLFCIFGGTPLPQIQWYKNGRPLPTGDRIFIEHFGKCLVLKHITEDDAGEYTCEGNNGVGDPKTHTMILNISGEPQFIEEPNSLNATETDTVVFACKVRGIPEPKVYWIYNGKPISEAPPNPRRKVFNTSIIIENVEESDIGNYGCNGTNKLGYVFKDFYVNVLAVAPTITHPPQPQEIVEGYTATIACTAAGIPKPEIRWFKNGLQLLGNRYTFSKGGNSLSIQSVEFADEGEYTCSAENKESTANATGTLTVKQRTQIESLGDVEVQAGTTAILACAVTQKDDSLDVKINWLKKEMLIDANFDPRFSLTKNSSLEIAQVTELDIEVYTCVASTRLDNDSAQTRLVVQDIPNSPQLLGVECSAKYALVRWKPMYDNGAPILSYKIQYNIESAPDEWQMVADPVSPPKANYNLTASSRKITFKTEAVHKWIRMSPWMGYKFRVIARNKIGLSTPSKSSSICLADPDIPYQNPKNVTVSSTEASSLIISWMVMQKTEHNGPNFYYEVSWKEDSPNTKWNIVNITDSLADTYVVHNVSAFRPFVVKVTAANDYGRADVPSREVKGYSAEDIPIEGPTNLTLAGLVSSTAANISWNGVSESGLRGYFKGYRIQIWLDDNQQIDRQVKEFVLYDNVMHTLIDGLTPNVTNFVMVSAFNGKYNSPPSNVLPISTLDQ